MAFQSCSLAVLGMVASVNPDGAGQGPDGRARSGAVRCRGVIAGRPQPPGGRKSEQPANCKAVCRARVHLCPPQPRPPQPPPAADRAARLAEMAVPDAPAAAAPVPFRLGRGGPERLRQGREAEVAGLGGRPRPARLAGEASTVRSPKFRLCFAVLSGFTALGTPVTATAGQVCPGKGPRKGPGKGKVRPAADPCSRGKPARKWRLPA
jgi:hypothetical protein